MSPIKTFVVISLFAGVLGAGRLAAAEDEHKAHHPEEVPPAAEAVPQPQGGMGGMGGMGMMSPDHMKTMREMHDKMMSGVAMGPKGDTGPASQAYAAANVKMHQGMAITFTGDADVDFAKGMIAHHQGAIDMAKVELQYGKDAKTRKLAEDIIKVQEAEIAMITEWLKGK